MLSSDSIAGHPLGSVGTTEGCGTAEVCGTAEGCGTVEVCGTAEGCGTAEVCDTAGRIGSQVTSNIPGPSTRLAVWLSQQG